MHQTIDNQLYCYLYNRVRSKSLTDSMCKEIKRKCYDLCVQYGLYDINKNNYKYLTFKVFDFSVICYPYGFIKLYKKHND